MSIQSKARRDASRKKNKRQATASSGPARPPVEPHGELRDAAGKLLGGVARRDGEWVLGLDGRMVGGSTSAATILSLLKRAAAMQQAAGVSVRLRYSDALRDAAESEAAAQGLSLEEFRSQLDKGLAGTPTATTGTATGH